MDYSGITPSTDYQYTPPMPDENREAVGLFSSVENLQAAIRTLEGSAFPRHDISVMGTRKEIENVFGDSSINSRYAMDNKDVPRQAPSRPEEQTIGTSALIGGTAYVGAMAMAIGAGAVAVPAIIGAAAIGAVGGGTIGAVLAKILGDRYDEKMEDQINNGGILLWVRTPDAQRERLAMTILRQHHASNVHIHEIE